MTSVLYNSKFTSFKLFFNNCHITGTRIIGHSTGHMYSFSQTLSLAQSSVEQMPITGVRQNFETMKTIVLGFKVGVALHGDWAGQTELCVLLSLNSDGEMS